MDLIQEAVEASAKINMVRDYMFDLEAEAARYRVQPYIGNAEYVERALTLLRIVGELEAIVGEPIHTPTSIGG